jgi:3',5'-nucleoside bisphosphate phosphatase
MSVRPSRRRWPAPRSVVTSGATYPIDLHTHTTASDGALAPVALVELAAELGVEVLAITDHDTTAGWDEAAEVAADHGIQLVPGIELNTDYDGGSADVLGYFFDPSDPDLQGLLTAIRDVRVNRARRMVEKLQAMGSVITYDDVLAYAGAGAVGRPHVAQALVAEGFVADVGEAFQRYIGNGGPAYAPRYKLGPADACRAIRAAGGVPSLAHPVPPNDPYSDPKRLRAFLPELVAAGLGGLECYYSGYTVKVNRWLEALAWYFKLVPTGGSDFHGAWRPDKPLAGVAVPADTVARLRAAAGGAT